MGTFNRAAAAGALMICGAIGAAHGRDFDHANWNVDSNVLGCPKTLKGNQTLRLTFGAGHGSELMISRANNGAQYELIVEVYPDNQKPLMTREKFASARSLEIPAIIKWRRTQISPSDNFPKERIFGQPGWYIVYLSNDLYGGAGGYTCTFEYLR
jgi:hypothetical protein